jgi:hypothetical protein
MGRTLNDVIENLPKDRRDRVLSRYRQLKNEVEGLRALREVVGKAQAEIAATLNIKQPSVSKLEKQTDMYLSTLRGYVEAVGGDLELVVHMPSRPPMRLHSLGDIFSPSLRKQIPKRREQVPANTLSSGKRKRIA